MKRVLVIMMVLALTAGHALGVGFGLGVGDTAAKLDGGTFRVGGGAVVADDVKFYGGRATFSVMDVLRVFVEGGVVDLDMWDDNGYGVGGGVVFCVPFDLPVDLAVRLGIVKPVFEDMSGTVPGPGGVAAASWDISIIGGNAAVIASYDLEQLVKGLSVYAVGGVNVIRTKTEWSVTVDPGLGFGGVGASDDETDTATDPMVGGGVLWSMNDLISIYAEVLHIDDVFGAGGVRITF